MSPANRTGEGCASTDDRVWAALVRYGRGEASAAEVVELERWAGDDPERRRTLRGVAEFGEIARQLPVGSGADASWERVRRRMVTARRTPMLRLAASERPAPSRWRRMAGVVAVAASIGAAALGGSLLLRRERAEPAPVVRQVATLRGERASFQLADGSRVVLGPETRMRWTIELGARERVVELEGAAHFTVAPDPQRPFVVRTAHGAAQALGTAFGVRAYPEDSTVQVVVASGRVALRPSADPMGSGTILDRGDLGVLGSSGTARVETNVDVDRLLGWTRGHLAYVLTPLADIIRDLERWYQVDIALADPSWSRIQVTVAIEPGSIDLALRRVTTVLGLRYVRTGSAVRLVE